MRNDVVIARLEEQARAAAAERGIDVGDALAVVEEAGGVRGLLVVRPGAVELHRPGADAVVLAAADVTEVDVRRRGAWGTVRVTAGETVVEVRTSRLQAAALRDAFARAGEAGEPESPVAPVSADPIDQIRRLGELRDLGLLTDEEFEAKKSELLGRI